MRRGVSGMVRAAGALVVAAVVASCAGAPRPSLPTPEERAALAWPPPPARARIAWAGTFRAPRDLRMRTGLWRRARRIIFGGEDERLVRPQGIAVVDETLYVTDTGRPSVLVYDLARRRYTSLEATAERPWVVPASVAATHDRVLFVADAVAGLYRLTPPWDTAEALAWPDLERPVAVAVDEARARLYVLDSLRHTLLYGTLDGRYMGRIGGRGDAPGMFNFPTHLAVAPDGSVLVTDAMNFRVQRFSPDGTVLGTFGQGGDASGDLNKPKGVAVGAGGTIYVVDALFGVVQLFDAEGRLLMWFGEPGRHAGQFWLPTGIAIDDAGQVYVADSYNQRVQMFTRLPEPTS